MMNFMRDLTNMKLIYEKAYNECGRGDDGYCEVSKHRDCMVSFNEAVQERIGGKHSSVFSYDGKAYSYSESQLEMHHDDYDVDTFMTPDYTDATIHSEATT